MNIPKAIEILELDLKHKDPHRTDGCFAAIKLGIEALKRCQELRKYTSPDTYMPLPGETKD